AGACAGSRRRHRDHRVSRDLPLLRGPATRSTAVRAGCARDRPGRDVEQAPGAAFPVPGLPRLSQLASRDEGNGGAAGAGLGRGQQAAHPGVPDRPGPRACEPSVRDRRHLLGRRHHRLHLGRLHEAGEAYRAGRAEEPQALACRRGSASERGGITMRLTVVGSGDAFGPGGPFNTCFMLETAKATLLVDFGASSLVALKAHGLDPNKVDGIVLSHLHGDHFGGLPFLLLDAQFLARRTRPLLIAGPPGTRARIDALLEACFPRSTANKWRFSWQVQEIEV